MKAPFDTVVEEHTAWLYGLVRNAILVQERGLKAVALN